MHIENIAALLAGFLTVVVPFYLLRNNSKSKKNRIFALTAIISGPLWAISISMFREAHNINHALFWAQGIYITAVIIGILFNWFANHFPRSHKKNPFKDIIVLLTGIYFIWAILYSQHFIEYISLNDKGNLVSLGIIYILWVIWLVGIFVAGGIAIIKDYSKLGAIEKRQLKYYTAGVIFPTISIIPTNAILPYFGIYEYIWAGPLFMIMMNVIIAYGMTRVRFVSAEYIYSSLIKIAVMALGITVLFKIGYYIYVFPLSETSHILDILIAIAYVLFISSSAIFLLNWTQSVLLKKIFKTQHDTIIVRDQFTHETSTQLDLTQLATIITNTFFKLFNISQIGYVVFSDDYTKIIYEQYKGIPNLSLIEILNVYANNEVTLTNSRPLVMSELEYKLTNQIGDLNIKEADKLRYVLQIMNTHNVAICFGLIPKTGYKGLFLIGPKQNNDVFTLNEIKLIKSLVNTISVALGRAFLYSEISEFNKELETKIQAATKQIQLKNTQLQETLRKERDMLDILGHELRTPMSIARNAISLLKSNIDKDTLDDEKLNKYINMADENIKRETKLLETMLSTTKVDKGDLGLDLEKVDLNDVIADSIEGLKQKATKKGLDIKYNSDSQIYVYADRSRIQEVVDNLVDNAVKYTKKGHVEIKIYKQGDKAAIEVNDTGIGIPESDLPNLGKKFFRVDTYIEAEEKAQSMDVIRPGGTGLGLYVIVNLVKAMDGTIDIQSKVDVGSNFTLTFPIFAGQAVKSIQKDITKLDKITEYKNRMAKKGLN